MAYEDTDKPGLVKIMEPQLLSFPNLKEARAVMDRNGKPTGKPKFSVNLEFLPDSGELQACKAMAAKIAKAAFPGVDIKAMIDSKQFSWPFANGDGMAAKAEKNGKTRDWSKGKTVLTARSQFRPNLSVIDGGRVVDLVDEAAIKAKCDEFFYTGSEVLAQVTFKAYEAVGNGFPGVNAYVDMVCCVRKGTRLTGGGRSGAEAFKDYVGTMTADDPSAGMGGEFAPDDANW